MAEFRFDINARNNASGEVRQLQAELRSLETIAAQSRNVQNPDLNAPGYRTIIGLIEQTKAQLTQLTSIQKEVANTANQVGASMRVAYSAVSSSALTGATKELERQLAVMRQLGDQASTYTTTQNAQLQTRLSALRAESDLAKRVAQERAALYQEQFRFQSQIAPQENIAAHTRTQQAALRDVTAELERYSKAQAMANAEQMKFAQQTSPRSSVADRQSINKFTFDQETAGWQRVAAAQQAATSDMVRNLRTYQTELTKSTREQFRFQQQISDRSNVAFIRDAGGNLTVIQSELDGVTRAGSRFNNMLGLNRIGMLELEAAGVNTFQALAAGMDPFHVALMESSQVLGALIQGGLIPAKTVIESINTSLGRMVIGWVAVAAATALAIYQAIRQLDVIKQADASLRILGQAGDRKGIIQQQFGLQREFGVTSGAAADIAGGFNNAPVEVTRRQREELGKLALAYSEFRHIDLDDTLKKFSQASDAGASGLLKLTEELNIQDSSWRRHIRNLIDAGDKTKAVGEITAEMTKRFGTAGLELARRERPLISTDGYGPIALLSRAGRSISRSMFGGEAKPELTGPAISPEIQAGTQVAERLTEIENQRINIQKQINALKQAEADITRELARGQLGILQGSMPDQGLVGRQKEIKDATANLAATAEPKTIAEEHAHSLRVQRLQVEIEKAEQAAQRDITVWTRVAELRKQLEDEVTQHITGALDKQGAEYKRQSVESIKLAQDTANARRQGAIEQLGQRLFESEFRAAQAPNDPRVQLVEAQKRLNDLNKDEVANKEQIRSTLTQIVALEIQVANYAREAVLAGIQQREVLAQVKGDLATIVSLRREEAALVLANPQSTPAQRIQAQTRIIEAQAQAQQKAIQQQIQGVQSANQFLDQRAQTAQAMMGLEVARYNMSREQQISAEQRMTSAVMAEQEKRMENLLSIQGLTVEQRIQINDQLASLYERDAQKQVELQTRLTEQIQRENQKRVQYFKNFFESVEQGASDLLIAGLTRSQTRTEALRNLARNLTTSFVTEMTKMGSQYAGKGLADLMGIKLDPGGDTSISSVLAKGLGSALGLTKPEPKLDQATIAAKMDKAADAHQKAAEALTTSAAKLTEAANAGPFKGGVNPDLTTPKGASPRIRNAPAVGSAVNDFGATGEYGTGQKAVNLVDNEKVSSKAQVAVDAALESQGEKLKNYCAILVNQALERAGVSGSGSGLASSFKTFGTAVDPSQVQKGDVFYAGPSGRGDTGHVGLTLGGVEGGRVEVMSSHMSGPDSNPAGKEWRNAQNLMFRRPNYDDAQLAAKIQADTTATQQSIQATQQSVQISGQGDQVNQENTTAVKDLTSALKQPQQVGQKPDGMPGSSTEGLTGDKAGSSGGLGRNLGLLTQGLGIAASAAAIFGRQLSPTARAILGTVGIFSQLIGFAKNVGSAFDLMGAGAKVAGTASTLLSTANTANTVSTTLNTTATYANSTAQSTGAAGSGIGSIFKAIPLIGMLFEHGGIVPSAAGGMISSGGLSILHPREMVLPANISQGLQGMIERGGPTSNSAVLNYSANVNGYHPYGSKDAFQGLLRQHGNALLGHVENAVRNGWRP